MKIKIARVDLERLLKNTPNGNLVTLDTEINEIRITNFGDNYRVIGAVYNRIVTEEA